MIEQARCVTCSGDIRRLLVGGSFVWRHAVRPANGHDAKPAIKRGEKR